MAMMTFLLRMSEEEKYAYNEAAHEARMSMSEWIREVLNGAAGNDTSRQKQTSPSMDSLLKSGAVKTGKDLSPSNSLNALFKQATTPYVKKPEIGPDGYPIMHTEER